MDEGDAPARQVAVDRGNTIVTIEGEELARWQEAAQPVIESWIADMQGRGIDGAQLIADAKELVAAEAK